MGIPLAAAAAALCVQVVVPRFAETYALYPLLLGTVFLGLPHGALDHLVPARLALPWGRKPLFLALYLLAYVTLAGAFLALWLLAPKTAFTGFLLVTVVHWGHGDLRFMELFWGRVDPTRWGTWATGLTRGALPIAVPVLAFPETAERLYQHAALGLGVGPASIDLAAPWLVGPLIALLGTALVAYVSSALRAAPNSQLLLTDAAEIAVLIGLFAFVPAYLAIGVYFLFWHALRHLARLLLLEPEDARSVAEGRMRAPLRRLMRDSVPMTALALALLGGLYLVGAPRIVTLEGFVALYLVLISALTVPHAVVVALLDVWRPTRGV